MNAQEYISSGILETYALGAATQAEKLEVENMLVKYPEVRQALDEIQKDIEAYATLHAVEPDKDLKEWIIESAVSPVAPPKVIALETSSSRWKNFAIAASLVLIVSVGGNILLGLRLKKSDNNAAALADLNNSILKTSQDESNLYKITQARLDSAEIALSIIRNPMTQSIALNSLIKDHPMKAVVHWNMKSMEVAVDPMTLPKTAPDEKYVLWAIVDGKPVNEGGFVKSDSTGLMMMKVVPAASAFAISLEKSGDVTAPAGPIYVSGAAPSTQP